MHEEVLQPAVVDAARKLGALPWLTAFYLSGGTAAALQLGHRRSRDLDFFTRRPASRLPESGGLDWLRRPFDGVEILDARSDQIQVVANGVHVTFLAYPFSRPHRNVSWAGLSMADLRTLAVQKAYTIGRRPMARDYLDLAAIIRRGVIGIGEIARLATSTYGDAFSERLFLQQLTYTKDLPDIDDALSLLVAQEPFSEVEATLRGAVRAHVVDALKTGPKGLLR